MTEDEEMKKILVELFQMYEEALTRLQSRVSALKIRNLESRVKQIVPLPPIQPEMLEEKS